MRSCEIPENLQAERELEWTIPHQPWNKIGMAPFTKTVKATSSGSRQLGDLSDVITAKKHFIGRSI